MFDRKQKTEKSIFFLENEQCFHENRKLQYDPLNNVWTMFDTWQKREALPFAFGNAS